MEKSAHLLLISVTLGILLFTHCHQDDQIDPKKHPVLPFIPSPSCGSEVREALNAELIPFGRLSLARAGMNIISADNKLVFASGSFVEDENDGWPFTANSSDRVDVYNLTTHTWSMAQLSVSRSAIASIAAGNKIFFAGGVKRADHQNKTDLYYNRVDILNLADNTWNVDSLSEARAYVSAATAGSKILFAGGQHYFLNRVSDVVDIYDLNTLQWSKAKLSQPRENMASVTVGNKIYFAGGLHKGIASKTVDIYDLSTNSWTTTELMEPMGHITGIAVNGKIFWASDCSVEIMDPGNSSRSITKLYQPGQWSANAGQQVVMKNNKLVFFRHSNASNFFDIYDIPSARWSIGIFLVYMPKGASIYSSNDIIYVAGESTAGHATRQVWTLDF